MNYLKKQLGIGEKDTNYKNEILSGILVAIALIPESIAFSLVANVSPALGLTGAFIIGTITALIGGRPGMISGVTGAIAVIFVVLVQQYGVEYLFAAAILMGIFQIIFGVLKLGKFSRMIPYSVMLGFVNGLAIIILMSQLESLKVTVGETTQWMQGVQLYVMLGLMGLTITLIYVIPKFTKKAPATLLALIIVTVLSLFLNMEGITTVSDAANGNLQVGLPLFHIPQVPFTLETLRIILPYSLTAAMVGLIESLLCLNLIDDITDTRGRANRESIAQGLASIMTGLFGAIPGCAMIGQSMINISSNGLKYLSGLVAAIFLFIFVVFAAPIISLIPMGALTGLMIVVVVKTFGWNSFKFIRSATKTDAIVMIIVTSVTVLLHNLALAVFAGIIISALAFAWEKGTMITVKEASEEDSILYKIEGPLFFASVSRFKELFDFSVSNKSIILDFSRSQVMDHSAVAGISYIIEKFVKMQNTVHLINVSEDCKLLLKRADNLISVNIEIKNDLKYHVADNALD